MIRNFYIFFLAKASLILSDLCKLLVSTQWCNGVHIWIFWKIVPSDQLLPESSCSIQDRVITVW
jgi:hypothetical protein